VIDWLTADDLTRYCAVPLDQRKLWLVDSIYSNGNVIRAAELIKQHWPEKSRFLVLGRGRRRKARRTSADTVYIDANVLSKKQFINATKAAYFDLDIESVAVKWSPRHIERLGKFEILVLEDNSTNQKVIRQQLQRMGYHVTVADNGVIGLRQAKQKRFDLILSDLHMPEMDGYQFITQLRAYEVEESLHRTPVIALTANIVQDELTRAKDLGMDDYLVKPLPVEQLRITLEHYLTSEHEASIQKPSASLFIDEMIG
jgi:CheY-like chemotaxis protein